MTQVFDIKSGLLSQNYSTYGPVKSVASGLCALDLVQTTKTDSYFISNEKGTIEYMPFKKPAEYISISPEGKFFIVVNEDKEIELQDSQNHNNDRYTQQFRNKGETIKHVSVDWTLLKMATAWSDNSIIVFDIRAGQEGHKLSTFKVEHEVTALATNGRYIATALAGGQVLLNLIWGGEPIRTYKHDAKVTKIEMTKEYVASGDEQGVIFIKQLFGNETQSGKIETEDKLPITSMLISKNAHSVFVGNTGSVVKQYKVDGENTKLMEYKGEEGDSVTSLSQGVCNEHQAKKIAEQQEKVNKLINDGENKTEEQDAIGDGSEEKKVTEDITENKTELQ